MPSVARQWFAMSFAACLGLFFVNPPFWTLLLMSGRTITPQLKWLAKTTGSALEGRIASGAVDVYTERHERAACQAANHNEHLIRVQVRDEEEEAPVPLAA